MLTIKPTQTLHSAKQYVIEQPCLSTDFAVLNSFCLYSVECLE